MFPFPSSQKFRWKKNTKGCDSWHLTRCARRYRIPADKQRWKLYIWRRQWENKNFFNSFAVNAHRWMQTMKRMKATNDNLRSFDSPFLKVGVFGVICSDFGENKNLATYKRFEPLFCRKCYSVASSPDCKMEIYPNDGIQALRSQFIHGMWTQNGFMHLIRNSYIQRGQWDSEANENGSEFTKDINFAFVLRALQTLLGYVRVRRTIQ